MNANHDNNKPRTDELAVTDSALSIVPHNRPLRATVALRTNSIVAPDMDLTLNEAIAHIHNYETELHRCTVSANVIRIDNDHLVVGDRALLLDCNGTRRLCNRLGAPPDYISRLGTELRTDVLTHHFRNGLFADPKMNTDTLQITSRGDTFVDINRSDLFTLSSDDVLQALKEGIGPDASTLEVASFNISREALLLDIVSPLTSYEVRRGDVIRGGLRLEHSFLGEQATTVVTYFLRLVCKNGLVHRDCLSHKRSPRTRRLATDQGNARELQRNQIRRLAANTWPHLLEKLQIIRRLQHEPVDAQSTLDQFLRRSRIHSRRLMEILHAGWQAEGSESTAFGVLNAHTRVATHSTYLTERQRRMLAQLAGIFANRQTHVCPRCFSVLHAPTSVDSFVGQSTVNTDA